MTMVIGCRLSTNRNLLGSLSGLRVARDFDSFWRLERHFCFVLLIGKIPSFFPASESFPEIRWE
jgi:hypothetical protein